MSHDLVIRGGTVVDGTGAPARTADVAITDGVVTAVGRVDGSGREEVDADGALVTPGFVDIHTHYDGQATWDEQLTPSCWHGVTTVVMGNCGVGFAPVAPDRHEWLIGLMEGVEDIPGAALSAGIEWGWETFPEFMDALDDRSHVMDLGTQVPHGAVRAYVMGERGARNEPASSDDIEAMAEIVRAGIEAGALGFSTSRTLAHRAIDGEPVPGTFAAEDELFGIGRVLGELGTGVFELAPAGALGEDLAAPEREMDWMRRLAAAIDRPVTFALSQNNADPTSWQRMLDLAGGRRGRRCADPAPGPRAHRVAAARVPDLPPDRVHADLGRHRDGVPALAGAGRRASTATPSSRPGSWPTASRSRTTRWWRGSPTPAGSTCSATRRSTSRAPTATSRPWPRPGGSRCGSCCST